jgi:hypothetical protein
MQGVTHIDVARIEFPGFMFMNGSFMNGAADRQAWSLSSPTTSAGRPATTAGSRQVLVALGQNNS